MDEIKVHVVQYANRKHLMMRYKDPVTGKQVARSTKKLRRHDAERVAGQWEKELRDNTYRKIDNVTWDEFVDSYIGEKLDHNKRKTSDNAITALNHVTRVIAPKMLRSVDVVQLRKLVRVLRAERKRTNTIHAYLTHIRVALNWAVENQYLASAPKVPMPSLEEKRRGRSITAEEFDRMIAAIPKVRKQDVPTWERLLRGLWTSGLRIGEALTLSWDDTEDIHVTFDGKYPKLRFVAGAQKNKRDQKAPIAPEFVEMLLAVPKEKRKGRVFGLSLSQKRTIRNISAIGKTAGVVVDKQQGKYATAHDLRRSFGTRWAKLVRPPVLRELMRHRDIKTTMDYYVDLEADDIGDELRKALGNTLGNTSPQTKESGTSCLDGAASETVEQ